MTWARGEAVIQSLIERGELQRIPYNSDLVGSLLTQSEQHLGSAEKIAADDLVGAYELAYDAMRKTATALLVEQGLRPTSSGGHVVVQNAVQAQFGGGGLPAFRSFNRLRRVRNDLEYPDVDRPGVDADEVTDAIHAARSDLDFARQLLDSSQLTMFTP